MLAMLKPELFYAAVGAASCTQENDVNGSWQAPLAPSSWLGGWSVFFVGLS